MECERKHFSLLVWQFAEDRIRLVVHIVGMAADHIVGMAEGHIAFVEWADRNGLTALMAVHNGRLVFPVGLVTAQSTLMLEPEYERKLMNLQCATEQLFNLKLKIYLTKINERKQNYFSTSSVGRSAASSSLERYFM